MHIHQDRAAAMACGHANIVAPATSVAPFTSGALWTPGTLPFYKADRNAQPIVRSLRPPMPPGVPTVEGYFATDIEFDFPRPVLVGERLGRRAPRILNYVPKETRIGRGAFLGFETETLSSSGDAVASMRFGMFCYKPLPLAQTQGERANRESPPARTIPELVSDDPDRAARSHSEVHEGDWLEPLAFPLTVYRLVVAARANCDFNAIHHNCEFARASGATDLYANNLFLQGMWERAVRRYVGPAARIHSLRGFRMSSFNCAGDTVVVRGQVQRKCEEAGTHWVEIRLWSENSQGISVGPGSTTVSLPR